MRGLVDLGHVGQRHGVADARDDVLALRVLQVVAVHALVATRGVAREADARPGVGAEVAEHHRLDVDGGAEVLGDLLLAAVEHGAVGVPRVEDGADGQVELLARLLGERPAGFLLDDRLVGLDQLLEVLDPEVGVGGRAAVLLEVVEGVAEQLALDAQHRAAEHVQQPPVGVVREAGVVAARRQTLDRLVVETDVEDGLHHPGHRGGRPRAHRHQQRVAGRAEAAAHRLLEGLEVLGDLVGQAVGLASLGEVRAAGLRGDREPGWHRQSEVRHLGEVRPLAAEEVLLVLVAVREVVDVGAHEAVKHFCRLLWQGSHRATRRFPEGSRSTMAADRRGEIAPATDGVGEA